MLRSFGGQRVGSHRSPFILSISDAPIDVTTLVNTTVLCANRVLCEPGVALLLAGFYKDLLAEEVEARLVKLSRDCNGSSSRASGSITLEMIKYIRYYPTNTSLLTASFALLEKLFRHPESVLQQLIAERVPDNVLLHIATSADDALFMQFINLFHTLVNPTNQNAFLINHGHVDWMGTTIDRLVATGLVVKLIEKLLSLADLHNWTSSPNSLASVILVNLMRRTENQQPGMVRRLFAVVVVPAEAVPFVRRRRGF